MSFGNMSPTYGNLAQTLITWLLSGKDIMFIQTLYWILRSVCYVLDHMGLHVQKAMCIYMLQMVMYLFLQNAIYIQNAIYLFLQKTMYIQYEIYNYWLAKVEASYKKKKKKNRSATFLHGFLNKNPCSKQFYTDFLLKNLCKKVTEPGLFI